jgi:hypothetical protein
LIDGDVMIKTEEKRAFKIKTINKLIEIKINIFRDRNKALHALVLISKITKLNKY